VRQPVCVCLQWRRSDGSLLITTSQKLLPPRVMEQKIAVEDDPGQLEGLQEAIHDLLVSEEGRFGEHAVLSAHSIRLEREAPKHPFIPVGALSWPELDRFARQSGRFSTGEHRVLRRGQCSQAARSIHELEQALQKPFPRKDLHMALAFSV
jgi:hypothetical protein